MSFKKIDKKKLENRYKHACSQGYCPSLMERKNNKITELANILKADSKKETLTNIAEWQNNNVVYWFERYLSSILVVSGSIFLGFLLSGVLGVFRRLAWLAWLFAIFGTISATLVAMTILMIVYYRKISLRHFFNVFRSSNPIDFLIEKKLAVCRDYAKLAACLLFNIYPETEIYFVYATRHVATGIMVGEKLYILDKYLPVARFDEWHKLWHKRRFSDKKVEKAKDIYMESVPDLNSLLSKMSSSKLDTDKLAYELEKLLNIERSTHDSKKDPIVIWQWKNGAILYENDEIVNYSIAQRLKKIISNEILDKDRIANIKIDLSKHDFIFKIMLK
jgi:predicted transglutaminase-like protease